MGNEKSGGSSSSPDSSNSSKKGKNKSGSSNNSDKPKQPQRGLGVAQLEKIRLQGQMANPGYLSPHHHTFPGHFPNPPFQHIQEEMRIQAALQSSGAFGYSTPPLGSASSYGYHPNFMMRNMDDPNIKYIESQSYPTARWNPNNVVIGVPESQPCTVQQPTGMVTRHLLNHVEQISRNSANLHESMGSSSQNSEPNDNEELDLELKL